MESEGKIRRVDALGKILFETYRGQIEKEFQYHPDKEEIIRKMQTGEYENYSEIDRWFDEAGYYNSLHWEKRFKQLAQIAENEGIKTISFRKVEGKRNGEKG